MAGCNFLDLLILSLHLGTTHASSPNAIWNYGGVCRPSVWSWFWHLSGSGCPAFGPGSVQNAMWNYGLIKLWAWGGPTNGSRFSTLNSCFSQFTGALVSAGKMVSQDSRVPQRNRTVLKCFCNQVSQPLNNRNDKSGYSW